MKYIKKFEGFENNNINVGWRTQRNDVLKPTIGQNATEGEGYYLFEDKEVAASWVMDKDDKLFKVTYHTPKNPLIGPEFLSAENGFLFYGESDDLWEPVKETDSYWVKIHKQAVEVGGEDLALTTKELTRIIKNDGYDAVMIPDEIQPWIVLMDEDLIISSEIVENI